MGNWPSVFDCGGASRVLLDTHPEVEFSFTTGLQTTQEESVRLQRQREAIAIQQVAAKEARCRDLESEIGDLEAQALSQHQILRMHAPGTVRYRTSIDVARRAITASVMKKKELAREAKLVELGQGILHRMQMVDSSSVDQDYFENLRQLTAAINPDVHARNMEALEIAASSAVDNADVLHDLQAQADGAFSQLDFTPVELDGADVAASSSSALSDEALIAALERMAADRAPPPRAMVPASTPDATPDFPEAPSAPFVSQRRTALAVTTTGQVSARSDTARQNSVPKARIDHYSSLY